MVKVRGGRPHEAPAQVLLSVLPVMFVGDTQLVLCVHLMVVKSELRTSFVRAVSAALSIGLFQCQMLKVRASWGASIPSLWPTSIRREYGVLYRSFIVALVVLLLLSVFSWIGWALDCQKVLLTLSYIGVFFIDPH